MFIVAAVAVGVVAIGTKLSMVGCWLPLLWVGCCFRRRSSHIVGEYTFLV